MDDLAAIGFSRRWEALLSESDPSADPGRVLRHDGVSVQVRTSAGDRSVRLRRGLPPVTVGDWLALDGEQAIGLLDRASLLRRRASGGEESQLLAANVDLVLLVMGLDRPMKAGRIRRGEALAFDAGAHPVLVLTKADLAVDVDVVLAVVEEDHPGLEVIVTSAATGEGLDQLRERMAAATSVLLGESGAGKSRLVNALIGADVAAVGLVRDGDRKGRHTTSSRQLHLLPSGGVVIDSPGIREVGLAGDEESVGATFADIDEVGQECRFADCQHAGEPGCAVALAIEVGEISADRLEAYRELSAEAAAAARRADEHERRSHERRFAKQVNRFVRSEHHRKK
ncbi:MAG: ribosome small subunit-dependent GTPase A [Candidatus Nanopelagicales bacterium]